MLRGITTLSFCTFLCTATLFTQDVTPRYVEYATYLGGSGADVAFDVAVDREGHIFLAGATGSIDLLAASGFDNINLQGDLDAVIVKLDPEGLQALAVAVIGGPGRDVVHAMHVTPGGEVLVLGEVARGFDARPWSCREMVSGSRDVFVARLDNELKIESGAGAGETLLKGRVSGLRTGALLSGVTVTGGIVVFSAAPRIENVVVEGSDGAGVRCVGDGAPELIGCTIRGNGRSPTRSPGGPGGVLSERGSHPVLVDCVIRDNEGPGVRCGYSSGATLDHCTISGNEPSRDFNGFDMEGGGRSPLPPR